MLGLEKRLYIQTEFLAKTQFILNMRILGHELLLIPQNAVKFAKNSCRSNMKCKTRALFISIALSFLIGSLVYYNHSISQAGETPFGTLAETISFYDYLLDAEEASVSRHDIISEINEGDALRHFSQSKRVNSSSSSKYGSTFIKRNNTPYSSPLIFESLRRFPSGLSEGRRRLISLGKLII